MIVWLEKKTIENIIIKIFNQKKELKFLYNWIVLNLDRFLFLTFNKYQVDISSYGHENFNGWLQRMMNYTYGKYNINH